MNINILAVLFILFIIGCTSKSEKVDYSALARECLNKHDLKGAFKDFEKAINQDPDNLSNYLIVGKIYLRLHQYQRAVYVFDVAARIDHGNKEVQDLLVSSRKLNETISQEEQTKISWEKIKWEN